MTTHNEKSIGLFPPLLKYWRGSKGLSQLDLGLAANVSARHISFLETGRAKPSKEMILTLAATLEVPLREQNTMLGAAGFEPAFAECNIGSGSNHTIDRVIDLMLKKHDPYPMIVMDWGYDLIKSNLSAQKLLQNFIYKPAAITQPFNMYDVLFNPNLARPFIKDWENFAHKLLSRIHRESILKTYDRRLTDLLDNLMSYPGVPEEWRIPDFSETSEPILTLKLQKEGYDLSFLSTITTFSAPQNISAQEVLIESFYPTNEETEEACKVLYQQ